MERESGETRLRPKPWHPRSYVLRCGSAWIEHAIKRISRDTPGARVIDLGCGEQPYRSLFESQGMTYHGVDLPGNETADSYFADSGLTTASTGTHDVALSLSVLEHVENPSAYLNEAYRVLRPEGYLVLATHGIWMYHPDPCDYWRWTCEGLRKQIEDSRFRVVDFLGSVGLAAAGMHLVQDSVIRRMSHFQKPIIGRLVHSGVPVCAMMFQLLIALADSFSNERNRSRDAMGFFVIARPEVGSHSGGAVTP